MYRKILPVWLLLVSVAVTAQKKTPVAWYIRPQATLLNGDHKVSGAMQLSSGVQWGNWYMGLGGAVDYYKVRSVPLFAECLRQLNHHKKESPFAYLRLGYDIAWPLHYQHTKTIWNAPASVFNNGWYAEGGLGYSWQIGDGEKLQLSLGYSGKTVKEIYSEYVGGPTPGIIANRTLKYTFNRLAFGLAFCW